MPTLATLPLSLTEVKPEVKTLFFKGDTALLEAKKVAIVGSRRPTLYTKNSTFALAQALKNAGIVVVSGAAMGVDALAHKGAFPQTIAVMANSLDLQVPTVNKGLIASMSQEALVVSEYPETTHPTRYSFVQRNRIVVGLSDIVILAQADLNSGTMRSAEFALALGKPLYVLPHHLGESLGTQQLLQQNKAEAILDLDFFIKQITGVSHKVESDDDLLAFCAGQPTYDEAVAKFQNRIFEYELMGKIEVIEGRVRVL